MSDFFRQNYRCWQDTKRNINHAYYFIRDEARGQKLGVSKVDLLALAYAYVLEIQILTDDSDMLILAKEYDIPRIKSLDLLKILHDCGVLNMKKVRDIASCWIYQNDTPKSYLRDYKKHFGERAPS